MKTSQRPIDTRIKLFPWRKYKANILLEKLIKPIEWKKVGSSVSKHKCTKPVRCHFSAEDLPECVQNIPLLIPPSILVFPFYDVCTVTLTSELL